MRMVIIAMMMMMMMIILMMMMMMMIRVMIYLAASSALVSLDMRMGRLCSRPPLIEIPRLPSSALFRLTSLQKRKDKGRVFRLTSLH